MKIKQAYLSLAQYRLKAKWEASDVGIYERLYQLNMDPEKCRYRLLSNGAVEEVPEPDEVAEADTLSLLQWYAVSPSPEKTVFQKDDEVHWGNLKITKSGKLRVQTFNQQKDEYLNKAVMEFLGNSIEFESAVEQEQSIGSLMNDPYSANQIRAAQIMHQIGHTEIAIEKLLEILDSADSDELLTLILNVFDDLGETEKIPRSQLENILNGENRYIQSSRLATLFLTR